MVAAATLAVLATTVLGVWFVRSRMGGNAGPDQSSDFAVRRIADETEIFDGGHAGIPSGAADTHDHIWNDITEGVHELTFVVDVQGQVTEIDENNNQAVLKFTVEPCMG